MEARGSNNHVRETVFCTIETVLHLPSGTVQSQTLLREDLSATSLDLIEIEYQLGDRLNTHPLKPFEIEQITSVETLVQVYSNRNTKPT